MEYRDNVRIDQSRVRYGGGGRGGRKVALGGGIGGLVLLLIGMYFGVDLSSLSNVAQPEGSAPQPACTSAADIGKNRECRWAAYEVALTNYWQDAFDSGFEPVSAVQMFSGTISTGCGTGSSEMGPFYCPADHSIYVDSAFTGRLLEQLGASRSDAAELYIMGHEYGHHISNLTGQLQKARQSGNQTGPKSPQVRLELQADCYAGVFFHNTIKDPQSPIASITEDDLKRIVGAARAVGDDHIQQQQTGRVVEESWTHGSSAQRQHWVSVGFQSGDPKSCDTFATDDLG